MEKYFSALLVLFISRLSPLLAADPVSDAINRPGRLASDVERDARSRPDVILPLLQLQAGDRVADITGHGFRLVAESDILRNPDDDHGTLVFDPTVRGKTDRFVLVFEKP